MESQTLQRDDAACKAGGLTLDSVRVSYLSEGNYTPLLFCPVEGGVRLSAWAEAHRDFVQRQLMQTGAVLFRGFGVETGDDLAEVIRALAGEPLEYRERSSPRTPVGDNVYTSTDYPATKSILLHNENSYQQSWPLKLFFLCETPAERGGETPLADCRRVLARLSPETRQRFLTRKWMLVRNYNDGFGLPWQSVFQSNNPAEVERHCRENGIAVEWKSGMRLRTRATRSAIIRHPHTGEQVWFNHAMFFHVSSVEPGLREALLGTFGEYDLPSNTFYGDGSPIEPEVMREVREAYGRETTSFPWQRGDLLMLDNILVAHGRAPYAGPRRVLVGMAQLVHRSEVEFDEPAA
jgi:alpha-ketoglutarate-dependent taurine dioxygenase